MENNLPPLDIPLPPTDSLPPGAVDGRTVSMKEFQDVVNRLNAHYQCMVDLGKEVTYLQIHLVLVSFLIAGLFIDIILTHR